MEWVTGAAAVSTALLTLMHLLRALAAFRVPRLEDRRDPEPAVWPSLSCVLPARDEAATIERALATLLTQDYPALEIVVVDDRSTDATGAILDDIAARDARVVVVRNRELPDGWLGKVHAMQRGLERSTGALVLFADCDTHYAPGALRRAVALLEARALDHLTLLPRFVVRGPMQAAMMAAFFDGYVERARGRTAIEVPVDGVAFGFGAFNLVRRAALDATAGLAWLKLDIADDLALGALLRSRGRSGFAVAPRSIAIEYYGSLTETVRGWAKNAFGILARFSYPRAAAFVPALLFFTCAPAIVALQDLWPTARLLVALWVVALGMNGVAARVRYGRPLVSQLLVPLTSLVMAVTMTLSAASCARLGGVAWRGTIYPLAQLRAGQRARFL